MISIHALLWSATTNRLVEAGKIMDFNPRTPVECDNFTGQKAVKLDDFNPRTPVECDNSPLSIKVESLQISIHALLWSATLPALTPRAGEKISIHALLWSATWKK